MTWLVNQKPIRSILLTRLRYLGDVTMSTPLFAALLAGDSDLRLGYLCEQAHGEILADHPQLDHLHLLGVTRGGQDAQARGHERETGDVTAVGTWGMIRQLRAAKYDLAVDLFFNPRSAWLLWLSGIAVRIGGTQKSRRHLYTHTVLRNDFGSAEPSLSNLAPGGLGEHLCRLAPLVHAESGQDFLTWVQKRFQPGELKPFLAATESPTHEPPYLVLAPGATWPSKEWPAEHWIELVTALVAETSTRYKVLVPPGREPQWGDLAADQPPEQVEILPAMDLTAVKNVLAAASGLISVDGGVMHMGVALGVPTLALFGPTDTNIWFPYAGMGPFQVVAEQPACQPCNLHHCDNFICLPKLDVARVLAGAREVFGPGVFVPNTDSGQNGA